jgi:sulfatase modifying factor 1
MCDQKQSPSLALLSLIAAFLWLTPNTASAEDPVKGSTKQVELDKKTSLEMVYIPPGKFMMGSSAEEKKWAVSQEGGATFSSGGGAREAYEGEVRPMKVIDGFWMGRTEVTVKQFRKFADETGFVTDAERPDGKSQCFNPKWGPLTRKDEISWLSMGDKSWRDPNHGVAEQDDFPVVCVSYNDMKAFCAWLTKKARAAGTLPEGLIYRLPTEAEWAYACRGGRSDSTAFWWGNNMYEGKGRMNISAIDFLPGTDHVWTGGTLPWSDGYAMVSPVDHYGEKGRNGFGLADMCGGVWEFVIDHFDPKGGHEEVYYEDREQLSVSRPVCRGGNYIDVPGNARCAVWLGIHSVTYSDSRDGFRVCLGVPRSSKSVKK